jgi:hypothetical protein
MRFLKDNLKNLFIGFVKPPKENQEKEATGQREATVALKEQEKQKNAKQQKEQREPQKEHKDFFDVLVQNVRKNFINLDKSKTINFQEIFDSVCSEFSGSVGVVKTRDFDFQLGFREGEGWLFVWSSFLHNLLNALFSVI